MPPIDPAPCPGREETIQLFLDGELSQPEREAFTVHVQNCPNCQRRLNQWQILFVELDTLKNAVEPIDLADQVMVNLPEPAAPQTWLGQFLLVGQFAIGLTLLVIAWPLISAFFGNYDLSPPVRLNLFNLTASLTQGLAETGRDFSLWLEAQRMQALGWIRFDLSAGLLLTLIAGCGLAWLAGNTLLLRANPPSFRNGETS